jgi:small multidrug resistance family-3 protein
VDGEISIIQFFAICIGVVCAPFGKGAERFFGDIGPRVGRGCSKAFLQACIHWAKAELAGKTAAANHIRHQVSGTAQVLRPSGLASGLIGYNPAMILLRTTLSFVLTACAEIAGCYLSYLWLKEGKSAWLLLPSAASLALFAWLLTLHPGAAARTYAAYGGVYVSVALLWLWLVESERPGRWDIIGVVVSLIGMSIIVLAHRDK